MNTTPDPGDLPWSDKDDAWLEALGISHLPDVCGALGRYRILLEEANARLNLTRVEGPEDFLRKHALDALAFLAAVPAEWRDRPCSVLDVGTGGGLPGIPLLLACPSWQGVLLDATRKKVEAVQSFLDPLGLSDRARALWGRAEDPACLPGMSFGLVVARAVKDLALLATWCAPYVAPGGRLVVSKGPRGPEELAGARTALSRVGLRLVESREVALPGGAGSRWLMAFERPLAPSSRRHGVDRKTQDEGM
ncbi:MAG: 16S rRNA (guanine(527)-N(7))-methyltransferase RsmG [Candidatus Sericytochromatia bacterium]|nr:16S rRNA (guanine(527)-N(7))-methyltransferase RsmG [Candidatus Sericytochromatia bacterium]